MKPTIVFLHGLNCSSKIFNFLQTKLPEHTPYFIDYDSHSDIETSYNFVLSRLPKKQPFSIIGHSLGGIIGHLITTRSKANVKNLVTISTPFGGSAPASLLKWFYPKFKVLKDLAPTSNAMQEIAEYIPRCPFLSLVSIAGNMPFISEANDGVVTIDSQTAIPATERIMLDANHFEAVQDEKCVSAIKDFIFK